VNEITRPQPLGPDHNVDAFDCGEESLDQWLQRHTQRSDGRSARTFVVCIGQQVIGYYALSAGSVMHTAVPGRVRRNMPDPIPIVVLGRLAIDRNHQGSGIGSGLLRDALLRSLAASETIGIRAVFVHSLTEDARRFYLRHGFIESPMDRLTLMLPIETIRSALGEPT